MVRIRVCNVHYWNLNLSSPTKRILLMELEKGNGTMIRNRAIINRFKRWREIRKLKRRIIALGTFISNYGWYPGVVNDIKRLEAMEREFKEITT